MFQVSVAILAGGGSRRMGTNKALLKVGQETLIERVVKKVSRLSEEIIVVTNDPAEYRSLGLRLVRDVYPGQGSLGGIYSGLLAASQEYTLVVACDMPFLNLDLLHYMIDLAPGNDIVMPRMLKRESEDEEDLTDEEITARDTLMQPLHAVYGKGCLEPIRLLLEEGDLRIISFFPQVRVRYVEAEEVERFDPERLSFFNINTPADLDVARRLAASERG